MTLNIRASGILGVGHARRLEEAGLEVIDKGEIERLSALKKAAYEALQRLVSKLSAGEKEIARLRDMLAWAVESGVCDPGCCSNACRGRCDAIRKEAKP